MISNRFMIIDTSAPTKAPGGVASIGIGLMQAASPPPPEAELAYKIKGEAPYGVRVTMYTLVNDVKPEMQEAEFEEMDAQGDYKMFMRDAKATRAADSKRMIDKELQWKRGKEPSSLE